MTVLFGSLASLSTVSNMAYGLDPDGETLLAAVTDQRPVIVGGYIEPSGDGTITLSIGSRDVLIVGASDSRKEIPPMVGKANEAVTVSHDGSNNAKFAVTCGYLSSAASAGTSETVEISES